MGAVKFGYAHNKHGHSLCWLYAFSMFCQWTKILLKSLKDVEELDILPFSKKVQLELIKKVKRMRTAKLKKTRKCWKTLMYPKKKTMVVSKTK